MENAIDTLEKLKLHPDFNFEEYSQHGDDFFKYLEYVNDQLDMKISQGECAQPQKETSSKNDDNLNLEKDENSSDQSISSVRDYPRREAIEENDPQEITVKGDFIYIQNESMNVDYIFKNTNVLVSIRELKI